MTFLFLKLLLSHIVGDFVAQPKKWVRDKEKKKHRSRYLYLHLLVHLIGLAVMLEFQVFTYAFGIITVILSHFFIDLAKIHLQKKADVRLLFIGDQLLHIVVLIGVAVYYHQDQQWAITSLYTAPNLLLLITLICLTSVSAVIMKVVTSRWKFKENKSLKGAGSYIGMLERLFVFVFILYNQWEAIGFLITAKSVFRFGDLSKAKDRKLTEYILIGTLLSFGLATLLGLAYLQIAEAL